MPAPFNRRSGQPYLNDDAHRRSRAPGARERSGAGDPPRCRRRSDPAARRAQGRVHVHGRPDAPHRRRGHLRLHRGLQLRGNDVDRRSADQEGCRQSTGRAPRDHRRRHRRHGTDARLSAGRAAEPPAEEPQDRVPAEQAVAPEDEGARGLRGLRDRRQVRGRLRSRLQREVPQPAVHRRRRGHLLMAQRFGIITEADARNLPIGSTVELEKGGHVTPLAQDTLRERRVTVIVGGAFDPELPADLAPVSPAKRIAIGSDHTGLAMKDALIAHFRKQGLAVTDYGTNTPDAVDYPDIAARVSNAVARKEADAGIVIDGAGIGSTIAANKVRGIRAAMCLNQTIARYAREHNGANVAALGSTMLSNDEAIAIAGIFLTTPTKEPRYLRRLLKVRELER